MKEEDSSACHDIMSLISLFVSQKGLNINETGLNIMLAIAMVHQTAFPNPQFGTLAGHQSKKSFVDCIYWPFQDWLFWMSHGSDWEPGERTRAKCLGTSAFDRTFRQ
jgi:hypothetical protein